MPGPSDPDKLPLLLVRHARAEDEHPGGDPARGLTPDGRAAFKAHARLLARQTRLVGVATSPLVRAVQTAELLAEAFGLNDVVVRTDLSPGQGSARRVVALTQELGAGWALVGHNPSLAESAARLLGLKKALPFPLKKGAALALRRDGKFFLFHWLSAPGKPLRTTL